MKKVANELLILYGSQTGQAQSIAEIIFDNVSKLTYVSSRLLELNAIDKEYTLDKAHLAIIICSSTGDGDPPENASKFYRRVQRKTLQKPFLANLRYTLLGLGDTNYNSYLHVPTRINERLQELGASLFYPPAFCDDAVGLDLVAEPWMDELYPALEIELSRMSAASCDRATGVEIAPATEPSSTTLDTKESPSLSVRNGIGAPTEPEESVQESSARTTSELLSLQFSSELTSVDLAVPKPSPSWLTIEDTGVGVEHVPGDAFYFICPNPEDEVEWLLTRLRIQHADNVVKISVDPNTTKKKAAVPSHLVHETVSVRMMFTHWVDVRRPVGKILLRLLAEYTNDSGEQRRLLELCSSQGRIEYNQLIFAKHLSILDILSTFPSCAVPVERLLEHLPRLAHRPLSVANWTADKRFLKFAYSLVNIPKDGGRVRNRKGLATGYLTKLPMGKSVPVCLKKGTSFRLPLDPLDHPLLLVGPGTGVAPFIAFLEYLEHMSSSKKSCERWLFFGCRDRELDMLYGPKLESLTANGTLDHLHIAESSKGQYVQDLFVEHPVRSALCELLRNESCLVYVCGDASGMANGVFDGFVKILTYGENGTSTDDAKRLLEQMKQERRYLQDIW